MYGRTLNAAFVLILAAVPLVASDPNVLHIGAAESLMEDVAPSKRDLFAGEMRNFVHDFTGLKSAILPAIDPFIAAKRLEEGRWHLGMFQGIEFGWAQKKFPKLQPLVFAVYDEPALEALLVVNKDSDIRGFADLKGKDVEILQGKLHCRLFADKETGGKANQFFGKLLQKRVAEEIFDDILLGKVQAAIGDTIALGVYRDINPGRFARLKIVARSEAFPGTVIAYSEGILSESLLKQLRDGISKANQTDRGREAMANFHIKSFQAASSSFQKTLNDIVKAYPAP